MSEKEPVLFTPECTVFRSKVENAYLDAPITVVVDIDGNHGVVHGNHRAYRAYLDRINVKREIIGTISKSLCVDPYYKPISELKVIEK